MSGRGQRRRAPMRRAPVGTLRSALVAVLLMAFALSGCTPTGPANPPTTPPEETTDPSPSASPSATAEPLAWGPTEAEVEAATATASAMSPQEVAGQVILARYPGTDPSAAADQLRRYHLGGLVLFGENVGSLDQVVATGEAVQEAQSGLDRSWPAIFAVDNEGGLVQRLSAQSGPWTSFPDFMAAGAANDAEVTHDAAQAMAIELRASGLNYDFAPVADVTIGADDAAIGTRSAGDDPERVAATVSAAVDGFTDGGMISSLKHFPGHGSLTVDSHEDLPEQTATARQLANRDLVPFQAGIEAGAATVMMGHIAVDAWDADLPASLSPAAYQHLREDLGFTGVAITDGLDMGALTNSYGPDEIAVMALDAGADLLLGPTDVEAAHQGIVDALEDGTLDRDRVDEAAGRVIAMMRWQAQSAEATGPVHPDESDAGADASLALSRAAITQVAGECGGVLAGPRIHVRGGSTADWDAFVAAAEAGGLEVVPLEEDADSDIRLVTTDTPETGSDVAIALDGPWLLQGAGTPVQLAAFGRTAGTFEAVVDVLTGEAEAPGTLPVQVRGLPATSC